MTQSVGAGRVIGQVFAHVYLSPEPQSLDRLTGELGISKGSASMTVRQLEQWGALRKVWVKGDRKDYYEATEDLGGMVRRALLDTVGSRMAATDQLLHEIEDTVKKAGGNGGKDREWTFVTRRLRRVRTFRDRAFWVWNHSVLQLLLKK
jgi:DNA-binding transcriptional regulator GbsR (MarR family)